MWASSAVNESYSANCVRTSSPSFWSPPLDIDIDHFIQVDFLRMTKVTKIALLSVPNQARVTEALIETSFDRVNWKDISASLSEEKTPSDRLNGRQKMEGEGGVNPSNTLNVKYSEDGVFLFRTDVKTRHIRITAKNYELIQEKKQHKSNKSSSSTASTSSSFKINPPDSSDVGRELIGLKLELFGCYLEKDRSSNENRKDDLPGRCSHVRGENSFSSLASSPSSFASSFASSTPSSLFSWNSSSVLFPAKHLSVNSHLNLIFVCEVSQDVR